MAPPFDPIAIALLFTRQLDALGIVHTIGGSVASSFASEPRSAVDIDVVAAITEMHVPALVSALFSEFCVNEDAPGRAVCDRSKASLIRHSSQLKVDLSIAGGTPLDEQQLAPRQAVEIDPARTLHVHPPEDILLQKLRWYLKEGGYLLSNAPVLGVADLLTRALRESGEECC